MSRPRVADMGFLILPHKGAQDPSALCTQFETATAGNTDGLNTRDAEINQESHRKHSKTEIRLKAEQESTDRKTHSNISVSA
jgi:hypothetical protein